MKKLVTAFAACALAGLVNAQVESVNIVGYSTINVPAGSSIIAPSFTTVCGDGTSLTLGMITPSEDFDAEALSGGGTIQFINADGSWGVSADYWANYGGWFIRGTETQINDTVIPKGGAVYVYSAAAATFRCAGEIGLTAFTVTIPAGSSQLGNSIPVGLTLGDITPSADFDAESATGGGTIQFINADGSWGVSADYWAAYGGWFIRGTETQINDTPLSEGAGFYVFSNAAATLTFPAVADL
jgi:hypothetical protein